MFSSSFGPNVLMAIGKAAGESEDKIGAVFPSTSSVVGRSCDVFGPKDKEGGTF